MSIEVKDICYLYDAGTAFEKEALSHVSFTIEKGEFVGIIGHTGSGKSTLIQHLNALLTPSSGKIYFDGLDVFDPEAKSRRKEIRRKVGLVFQYPEHQLFETTVWKDVSFGPVNMKLPQEEVEKRVKWAMDKVGLGPDYYEKSPFDLSGGQKRRVALAGVLAMQPEYLVLDEPTAGLDPRGRDELFESIASLCRDVGIAVILVSHSMEDVARYVDRLLVMDHGHLRFDDTPGNVFSHKDELEAMGLEVPQIAYLGYLLRQNGYPIPENIIKMDEMEDALVQLFGTKEARHDS